MATNTTKQKTDTNLAQAALNMAAPSNARVETAQMQEPDAEEQALIAERERRAADADQRAIDAADSVDATPAVDPPAPAASTASTGSAGGSGGSPPAKAPEQKAPQPPPAKPAVPPQKQAATAFAIPVRRGRMQRPRRTVIYGPPGVGKSTLLADATIEVDVDDLIVIDVDNGSEALDLPRYNFHPEDTKRGHVPRNLVEFVTAIRALRKGAGAHPFKRVGIDQLGRLELLAQKHILLREQANEGKELPSLESIGYGKGKQILLDEMRAVLHEIDGLIAAGIDVVILAHSQAVKFSNPGGSDFDRYQIKAAPQVADFVFEWADEVGFLHFDDKVIGGGKKGGRAKGTSTGRRILEFDRTAAWDAKARLPLPRSVTVGSASPWSFYRDAIRMAYAMTPADLRNEIENELERIGDAELRPKVEEAVAKVGDNIDKLTAYMQDLRRRDPVAADDAPQQEAADPYAG